MHKRRSLRTTWIPLWPPSLPTHPPPPPPLPLSLSLSHSSRRAEVGILLGEEAEKVEEAAEDEGRGSCGMGGKRERTTEREKEREATRSPVSESGTFLYTFARAGGSSPCPGARALRPATAAAVSVLTQVAVLDDGSDTRLLYSVNGCCCCCCCCWYS